MRKIKKINGYLVVRFNDRERREFEQLGAYGVIDAERYTGTLEVDRDVMEYDDAETLEAAMEQARGLESELDVEEPEVKVTVVKETDQASTEEEVDPQLLLAGWETDLAWQVGSGHYSGVTPTTARHELYGFKVALKELGLLDAEECYVLPGVFGSEDSAPADLFAARKERLARQITNPHYPDTDERTAAHELYGYSLALQDLGLIKEYDERFRATLDTFQGIQKAEGRTTFKGLPEEVSAEPFILEAARKVYALGLLLSEDCPDNDCRVYLNTFNMARELDAALNTAQGYAANVLQQRLTRLFKELREMYVHNHAVKEYREGMKEGPPDKQAAPCLKGSLPVSSEPETGSFCERAAVLLERFIDTAGDEVRNAPNDQAAKEREKLLIYLAKLNQREAEAAGARHRGELSELARLMETGYLEFWIKDTGAEDVTVEVFDGVLFRCRAELTFRKIPFQPHYVLGQYRPL